MHELGLVVEVVRIVEDVAREQGLTKIEAVVLRIGALSPVVPHYVEKCFPAATHGTLLEGARLEIEVPPANGRCRACGAVADVVANRRTCPDCGGKEWELHGGREFSIHRIVAC